MSQLYEFTRTHFAFLQKYGYICSQADDENSVSFVGKNNRIDINFSVVGYELTCQFTDNVKNTFTLQDALGYVDIKEFKGAYQMPGKGEIEQGVIYLADVVKSLFGKIDISDIGNFQKIAQYRLDMHKVLLEDYYCKIDIKRAEEYWKNRKYSKAQELYQKHISRLSEAQTKKLEYIKKKYK